MEAKTKDTPVLITTPADQLWMQNMESAFRTKAALHDATARWIKEAERNRRAFLMASGIGGLGWVLFWGMVIRHFMR